MKKIVQIVIISFVLFCNVGVQGFLIVDAEKTNQYLGGDFLRFIIVDGLLRSYQIHIPEGYNNDASVPIMFILHGITGSAQQVKLMSKMNEKSDEEEFIVVYPNGHINKQFFRTIFSPFVWNEWVVHDDVDDANFLHILIEKLQIDYNINSSRIYLCGISGGASMTYKFGALYSDDVASIASIAGTIGVTMNGETYSIPEPIGSLPVMIFHGTEDNLVPFDGGWAQGIFWKSVNESVAFWVEHNKCNITPLIESIGSGNVIKEIYENGTDDSEVVLFILKNSGHEWFGSPNGSDLQFFLLAIFLQQI
jgi:polyhydroxybutyrate depolymerase